MRLPRVGVRVTVTVRVRFRVMVTVMGGPLGCRVLARCENELDLSSTGFISTAFPLKNFRLALCRFANVRMFKRGKL